MRNGRVLKKFRLNELFFKQNLITSDFINNIMRGAAKTLTKEKSSQLVDDVRNLTGFRPCRHSEIRSILTKYSKRKRPWSSNLQ
jgi:hypothetical protein